MVATAVHRGVLAACVFTLCGCEFPREPGSAYRGGADVPDAGSTDAAPDASITDLGPKDRSVVADVLDTTDTTVSVDTDDVFDVRDASNIIDAIDGSDGSNVGDTTDATDSHNAVDMLDSYDGAAVLDVVDAFDVLVDSGPPDIVAPCTGPAMTCPCSATNPGGYCRPGEACAAGACVAGTVAGSLVITEIMNDPDSALDEYGEWFEVYNPGATPLDLRGMRISNSRSQSTSVTSTTSVIVAPRSYAVLGRNASIAVNGNVTMVYVYGATVMSNVLTFTNTSIDSVIIDLGSTTTELDRVTYDGSTGSLWPRTAGKAKSLRPTALSSTDNDMPSNWCDAPTRWVTASGDYGSPGVTNPACP